MKIFLSHSSTDKTVVRKVYDELGAALCHFDEATFDQTGAISKEIFNALNESQFFVFFASPSALQSKWVQGELERAFESWMRNGVRRAMVFLLKGTDVLDLPVWLQGYVMREPPSYRHILCRIQSEIDKERRGRSAPPFYRSTELQKLENKLLVEAQSMPGAILVHGPDGSGRKELLNELYSRQFPGVARRKLLIATAKFATATELYRDIVGLVTIATPSEFVQMFGRFDSLSATEKVRTLAETVLEATLGAQCLLVEADSSILTEDGRLPDWLVDLFILLSAKDYPRLGVITYRRPTRLPASAIDKLIVQDVPELDRNQSKILFSWWLKYINEPYSEVLRETVFEACSGNPRQLELGAKLLVAEGEGNIARIRPHLLQTLEGMSRQFLDALSSNSLVATILAVVANAGYITRSDLTQYVVDGHIAGAEQINDAIADAASYGFLIEDDVCIRMPDYLVRGARALGRERSVGANLAKIWEIQSKYSAQVALDDVTTISVLNEHCLAILRSGNNSGLIFDNVVLPSQCLQVARQMYEKERYAETHNLCSRAYEGRATLSKDGLIETLRFMGMAAARLDHEGNFKTALDGFSEIRDSKKATKMVNFLKGFFRRLDGEYDEALKFLKLAHLAGGGQADIHVLRELAFINLHTGDVPAARQYIQAAMGGGTAEGGGAANHYILELAVRAELMADSATVSKRQAVIEPLLEKLSSFDTSPDKIYWLEARCEYHLALNEPDIASKVLGASPLATADSPAIKLLKARILMKQGSHVQATAILERLYAVIKSNRTGQRRSILPIIARNLVESAAAQSAALGAESFSKCASVLPKRIAKQLATDVLAAAAYTRTTIAQTHLSVLNGYSKA